MQHYIIQVFEDAEYRAEKKLEAMGLIVTLPEIEITLPKRNARQGKKKVLVPALPGYLGISGHDVDIRKVKDLKPVMSFVGVAGRAAEVSQEIINCIANLSETATEQLRAEFKPGMAVEVIDGPFTGVPCKILDIKSTKGKLLLQSLGIVWVDRDKIRKAA